MIDDLHKNNFHVMFSFWPYFRPGSAVYDDMDKQGYFIDRTKVARIPSCRGRRSTTPSIPKRANIIGSSSIRAFSKSELMRGGWIPTNRKPKAAKPTCW